MYFKNNKNLFDYFTKKSVKPIFYMYQIKTFNFIKKNIKSLN